MRLVFCEQWVVINEAEERRAIIEDQVPQIMLVVGIIFKNGEQIREQPTHLLLHPNDTSGRAMSVELERKYGLKYTKVTADGSPGKVFYWDAYGPKDERDFLGKYYLFKSLTSPGEVFYRHAYGPKDKRDFLGKYYLFKRLTRGRTIKRAYGYAHYKEEGESEWELGNNTLIRGFPDDRTGYFQKSDAFAEGPHDWRMRFSYNLGPHLLYLPPTTW